MDYLVPAWHAILNNWAFGSPNYGFDDAVSNFKLLGQGQRNPGLAVMDYQPNLTTRIAQSSLEPRKLFSVFDYIQGSEKVATQVVDFYDFNWPAGVFFEFTPFHLIVRDRTKLFANVYFDMEGKVITIDYFHDDQHFKSLRMDDRGFVSQEQLFDSNNQMTEARFLDPQGNWRIKWIPQSDEVIVNPVFKQYFKQDRYDSFNSLIIEIVQEQFLNKLNSNDRLIVTVDDQSRVPQKMYLQKPVIFEMSKWHPFQKSLATLKDYPDLKMICDTQFTANDASQLLTNDQKLHVIPLYQAMFKLGHSQQLKTQRIYLLLDNTDLDDLQSLAEIVVEYMLNQPRTTELYLLSFGGAGDKAHRIMQQLLKRHQGQFKILDQKIEKKQQPQNDADNENMILNQPRPYSYRAPKKQVIPTLKIKTVNYYSQADILRGLDKARLVIDWGEHPDDLLQMAAVSIGMPMLQRVPTGEIIDGQNGRICRDLLDVHDGLHYYLDKLDHWNESLANDVQIMNEHSADKLNEQWKQVWQEGSDN